MDVIVPAAAVAGDDARVLVKIVNHGGTAVTNGTVHVKHPTTITAFQSVPEPDNYVAGEAIYAIGNLPAFGTQFIEIVTRIPATAMVADQFEFSVNTGTGILQKDADTKDNEAKDVVSLSRRGGLVEVLKQSIQGDTVDFRSKEWEYRVDFRNVSTTMVKRAVLVDTLDANLPLLRLELLSFYPSKASYTIEKGRVLVIDYPEANLSAFEANPAGSVGFAKYRVQIYQTLPLKTVINNRAMVDFDSKWQAYSTNCAVSLLDKFAGVKAMKSTLRVYPNPASAEVWISSEGRELRGEWQLMNHMGAVVRNGNCSGVDVRVDVKGLSQGLYTIKAGGAVATVMVQ
jgi:hypothetical protein